MRCLLRAAALCAVLAGTAAAQPADPPALLTTHAVAERRLPNTVSDVRVSIEVYGRDVPAAAAALSRRSQTLLDYLRAQGVERLRTEAVSFEPETQEVRGGPSRIKGFSGTGAVTFRTMPDRLPALLAGSLDNGATGLSQSGSAPAEAEVLAARNELAAEAARAALAQATALAEGIGQRVVGVQQVEVNPERTDAPGDRAYRQEAPRATRPIATEAGEASVSVTVWMRVRIAPKE